MWAALVKQTAPVAAEPDKAPAASSSRVAVVDANAIISGLRLSDVADRFVTTQDVLDEIRDKNARQFLATLPFTLEVKEPEETSVATVTAFARETGDLHALSRTDVRLLALAHSMEVATHGSSHLRQHPVQACVKPKHRSKGHNLPGWGSVPNPKDWAAMDALPDSAGQGTSRIRGGVQALDATPEADVPSSTASAPTPTATPTPVTAPAATALPFASFADAATADLAAATATGGPQPAAAAWFAGAAPQPGATTASAEAAAGVSPPTAATPPADPYSGVGHFAGAPGTPAGVGASEAGGDEDEEDEEEDGEWAQAGKSKAAERRRRRNQARYEARQIRRQEEGTGAVTPAGSQAGPVGPAVAAPVATGPDAGAAPAGAAAPTLANGHAQHVPEQGGATQEEGSGEDEEEGDEDEEGSVDEGEEEEEDEGEEEEGEEEGEGADGEEEEEEGTEGGTEAAGSVVGAATTASGTDCGEFMLNTTSNVTCVTGDFAMQNVLMQMGLRLVTKDGKQISRLSRWAVRCSACFFVTKEQGRLFCPRCGNMTLDRVEVTVGPGGAEFFGVRKKHVLRGTVFSIPKPKGGRAANPILREDEILHKLKPRRKKKGADKADLDPYAPQHGTQEAWQANLANGQEVLQNTKGAAFLLAGWKHNPNERKPVASNRRRK